MMDETKKKNNNNNVEMIRNDRGTGGVYINQRLKMKLHLHRKRLNTHIQKIVFIIGKHIFNLFVVRTNKFQRVFFFFTAPDTHTMMFFLLLLLPVGGHTGEYFWRQKRKISITF